MCCVHDHHGDDRDDDLDNHHHDGDGLHDQVDGHDHQLQDDNDDDDGDGDEIAVPPYIVLEASAIMGEVCQPVSSSRPPIYCPLDFWFPGQSHTGL